MRSYACTEDIFLKDVERHTMIVLRDDGVNRHIRFKRPDSSAYWFDLITWPGTLCIDGDCGTYVFRRLEDMFKFFRTDRDYALRNGKALGINLGYWSEKLVSTAKRGVTEFSEDRFREAVKDEFDQWVESQEPSKADKASLWEQIEDDVLSYIDDGEHDAIRSAMEFSNESLGFEMADFYEHDCREYTFHFIWCCYAIAWGVKTYDEAAEKAEAA